MAAPLPVIVPTDDLYEVPLGALTWKSTQVLSTGFAVFIAKVIEDSCYANLPDVLRHANFPHLWERICKEPAPTLTFLRVWAEDLQHRPRPSVGSLVQVLTFFERFDILYDITELVAQDVAEWRARRSSPPAPPPESVEEVPLRLGAVKASREEPSPGDASDEEPQGERFDAGFSFDEDDDYAEHIAGKIHHTLGTHYALKLCKGSRKAGSMELKEKLRLIKSQCRHVIVLLSRSYLKKRKCYQELYHMKVKDPMAFEQKIIPVLIENIRTPDILSDMVCVPFYNQRKERENYEALYEALK